MALNDLIIDQKDFLLPSGFRVAWDKRTKVSSNFRVLMGGSPWRMVVLDDQSARFAREIAQSGDSGVTLESLRDRQAATKLLFRGFVFPVVRSRFRLNVESASEIDNITIVIPIHERAEQLAELLSEIRRLDGIGRGIIVVDDGSKDEFGIAAVTDRFGARLVRLPDNRGPGGARNAGSLQTASPFIAFLDSDCLPTSDWVRNLLGHFEDQRVGVIAPRIKTLHLENSALKRFEEVRSSLDMGKFPDHLARGGRLSFVPSAALIVRREVFENIRFDESLRIGEDVDFMWRVLQSGWTVNYDPSVYISHRGRDGLRAWIKRTFEYGTSAADLERRHPGALTPAVFSGWNVVIIGALMSGRYKVVATTFFVAVGLLAWQLRSVPQSLSLASQVVSRGLVSDIEQFGKLLRREWWPVGALAVVAAPKSKLSRTVIVAMTAHLVNDWRNEKPDLDPIRYVAFRMVQDAAYGSGVIHSAGMSKAWGPLRPHIRMPLNLKSLFSRLSDRRSPRW